LEGLDVKSNGVYVCEENSTGSKLCKVGEAVIDMLMEIQVAIKAFHLRST
jgi:hypothetical protein